MRMLSHRAGRPRNKFQKGALDKDMRPESVGMFSTVSYHVSYYSDGMIHSTAPHNGSACWYAVPGRVGAATAHGHRLLSPALCPDRPGRPVVCATGACLRARTDLEPYTSAATRLCHTSRFLPMLHLPDPPHVHRASTCSYRRPP
jgi:hypothetical protein